MKIKAIILSLFIVLILNLFCSGKPKIEFDEMNYNFGDVNQYTSLIHTFYFTNRGNGTLLIKKIKAG